MTHVHQWGAWLRVKTVRGLAYRRVRHTKLRYCINGWCPMGQYENGRTFYARPERKITTTP